jgi:hypothetical protein
VELILKPRPLRYVFLSLLAAGMIGIGITFIRQGGIEHSLLEKIVGGLIVILFGALLYVFGSVLLPGGAYLKLTADGFTTRSAFRRRFLRWSDVRSFEVIGEAKGAYVLVFDYADSYPGRRPVHRMTSRRENYRVSDYDESIADVYAMAPAELAALMNQWRLRAGSPR